MMRPESAEVCKGRVSQYPTLFIATAYRFKLKRSKHVLSSRHDDSGETLVCMVKSREVKDLCPG